MEVIEENKFVMVGFLWILEAGNDIVVNKVSFWLYPDGG